MLLLGIDITNHLSILAIFLATTSYVYVLLDTARSKNRQESTCYHLEEQDSQSNKRKKVLSPAILTVLGIALCAVWILALYQLYTQHWAYTQSDYSSVPLAMIAAAIIVNIPIAVLTKHWHKSKFSNIPTVGTFGKGTVMLTGLSAFFFFTLLTVSNNYLAMINNTTVAVVVCFFVLTTLFNLFAALGSRWRILILEDALVIRPRIGKSKKIAYEDIERVEVDNPSNKLELTQIRAKNYFMAVATVNERCLNYNSLLRKLKEKDVNLEYRHQPSLGSGDTVKQREGDI